MSSFRLEKKNTCRACNKPFHPWNSRPDAPFCSVACRGIARQKRNKVVCKICNKQFEVAEHRKNVLYCSMACRRKGMAAKYEIKACEVCGKTFKDRLCKPSKCCSSVCRYKLSSEKQKEGKEVTCEICGATFYRAPSAQKTKKVFCSLACKGMGLRNRVKIKCSNCGKLMERTPSEKGKFAWCSPDCRHEVLRKQYLGKKSSFWRGGVFDKNLEARNSNEYKRWRYKIIRRDKACQNCGSTKMLHAHHIKSFAKYPKLRFDPSNGITLCKKCHEDAHRARLKAPGRRRRSRGIN